MSDERRDDMGICLMIFVSVLCIVSTDGVAAADTVRMKCVRQLCMHIETLQVDGARVIL